MLMKEYDVSETWNRIESCMREKGLTHAKPANMLCISTQSISKWKKV